MELSAQIAELVSRMLVTGHRAIFVLTTHLQQPVNDTYPL